ncbi:MAG: chromate efflux transporter [Phycisphaerales bacterium]
MSRALTEVCAAFLKLGIISFGGPIAHLGYFHSEFVARRRWIDETSYADLVALCQFLPGPASSQVAFALGMRRAGLAGALAASLCFLLPSAVLMIAFGHGVTGVAGLEHASWVHGLKLAAVAIVAQAVWGMWQNLCPDRPRVTICLAAAAILVVAPGAWAQIGVIAAGSIAGWAIFRHSVSAPPTHEHETARGHKAAVAALAAFVLLLFVPSIIASATGSRSFAVFDSFYRSGSLVFGGGHVVLPLLRAEVVPRGWVSDDAFLAGYGAAQALPGPLFTFAGYLGAVTYQGPRAWLGGVWCLLAIFLPAWLLIGGALPFWHQLRANAWVQAALRGANAAVVGMLVAALCSPVMTEGVRSPRDLALVLVAFGALQFWRAPSILVVAFCAGAAWLLG